MVKFVVALLMGFSFFPDSWAGGNIPFMFIRPKLLPYTWTGLAGDNNWNSTGNWSGNAVPGSSQVALFQSAACLGANCNVTFNVPINVLGLSIGAGYPGTLTQATGQSLTIGASGFSQAGGSFVGSNANITVAGTIGFSLTGGSFTSTLATLKVAGNANATLFTIGAGATYTANGGTLYIAQGTCTGSNNYYTISLSPDVTLNHLVVATDTNNSLCTANFTLSGGKFIVNGNLVFQRTFADGKVNLNGGNIDVKGNVSTGDGVLGGSVNVTLNGAGNQTYSGTSTGILPAITVDKSAGTVTTASTDVILTRLNLTQGSFTAPKGILGINPQGYYIASGSTVFEVAPGTTFTDDGGTLSFRQNICGASNQSYTLNLPTSLTVNHLELLTSTNNAACTLTWVIPAGDQFVVGGDFTFKRATGTTNGMTKANGGTIEVLGNSTIDLGANGGTTAIKFSGALAQTFTHNGGVPMKGLWTMDKSGGSFQQTTNMTFAGAGHNLNVVNGTWDMNNLNLTAVDTLNIQVGGVVNKGTGTLGYTTCGGPQPCP